MSPPGALEPAEGPRSGPGSQQPARGARPLAAVCPKQHTRAEPATGKPRLPMRVLRRRACPGGEGSANIHTEHECGNSSDWSAVDTAEPNHTWNRVCVWPAGWRGSVRVTVTLFQDESLCTGTRRVWVTEQRAAPLTTDPGARGLLTLPAPTAATSFPRWAGKKGRLPLNTGSRACPSCLESPGATNMALGFQRANSPASNAGSLPMAAAQTREAQLVTCSPQSPGPHGGQSCT